MIRPVLHTLMALSTSSAIACSCFGPNTFCGVLNPPYEEPQPWLPDAVVLAVPLQQYHYGIDMVIVQVFQGEVNNDTVRVWGDNGALCRLYAGWPAGDTLVLGIQHCDLLGNMIQNPEYPPDLEREEDYMISACGVYALDFLNGNVRGYVDQPFMQTFTLQGFSDLIANCALANGLSEQAGVDPLLIQSNGGPVGLEWQGSSSPMELTVFDTQGRAVIRRRWDGRYLVLEALKAGSYLVEVRNGSERVVRKVMVG
ncbi:MAG TPA: T9SS type A sorting domain-containing protein [Flavobacteriales bacterium]|nr:T9SS type A sorting domain-containing protein [Flavobacteriales bacterium]